ncbi:WD repeat domain 83 opposite strand L homeolog [Oopsacas minuta]|uniref:WD repeat domain 83 opposite strand L homeolog n=1 Tax=Oopsacas minuta TaxID=111878 RepID=A0AAV7K6T1_9METZ|nr:WD repeat domain 83 opposite strand L homeolog [Oopsacas minuta]
MDGTIGSDPRRPQKVKTYDFVKDPPEGITSNDILSFMGLIFSVLGLLLKIKYICWLAVYCVMIHFCNSSYREEGKQTFSLVM